MSHENGILKGIYKYRYHSEYKFFDTGLNLNFSILLI